MGLFNHHTKDKTNARGTTVNGKHNVRHDIEGLALGGIGAHEWNKHHPGGAHHGRHDIEGLAAGGLAAHEYNKHHHQDGGHVTNAAHRSTVQPNANYNNGIEPGMPAGIGAPTGGPSFGNHSSSVNPTGSEARHLKRSGKMDRVFGTLFFSKTLKLEGAQKKAEGVAMKAQAAHLDTAQQLEAQARLHRGQAVGLGADPSHAAVGAGFNSSV